MSNMEPDALGPDDLHAREAVRSLPALAADPAFQARLREQFMAGTIPASSAQVFALRSPWYRRPERVASMLAVAACLVLVVAGLDRGPAWQVTQVKGQGAAIVGERVIPLRETSVLSAALARGGRVQLPDGAELTLVAPGSIAVSLGSGSEVILPAAPGRWFARTRLATVVGGEAFFTTGQDFHGAHLTVTTEEARVEVVGTTFAVLRHPEGTCVCVMDGRVRVGAVGEAEVEVGAGSRRFCYPRALHRPSEGAPILDYSEHALHDLKSGAATLLRR